MSNFLNIIIFILGLIYPFILYFFKNYSFYLMIIFSLLLFIKSGYLFFNKTKKINNDNNDFIIKKENKYKNFNIIFKKYTEPINNPFISLFLSFVFFLFIILNKFIGYYGFLIYFYPIVIYLTFFVIFIQNIKTKPIITSFAEAEHLILNKDPLTDTELVYTRRLTYIWLSFFLISAILCILLSLMDNKFYWTLYTGFIGYIVIGFIFIFERIFRRFLIKILT